MGKLKGSRVYLAGPMDRVPDRGKSWRQYITPLLHKFGIFVLDPTRKHDYNISCDENISFPEIQRLKKQKKFSEIRSKYKQIRNTDLRLIDISDFVIAYVDVNTHLCGTYEEIFCANRQKKPVLLYINGGITNIPNWLIFTFSSEFFFDNWDDLLRYLEDVDYGRVKNDRWMLVDLDGEFKKIISTM